MFIPLLSAKRIIDCLITISLLLYATHAFAADPPEALSPYSEQINENNSEEPLSGRFSSSILKNSPYSNSIEAMGMFMSQTGVHQLSSRLSIAHREERFALRIKGSFQEFSNNTKTSQSTDAKATLEIPISTFYGYLLTGAQWRSDRTDFYYAVAGPGMEVIKGLRVEVGVGKAVASSGSSSLLGRMAFDFEYNITDRWGFEERFDVFTLYTGPIRHVLDSDTILRYHLTSQAAFKTGLSYTSINDSWSRLQVLVGLSYQL
jgi:hypothetical protein